MVPSSLSGRRPPPGPLSPSSPLQVRAEIAQLESQYESGEIWVGKEADLGAQISVKSVRGDRVLWVDRPALLDGPFAALRELVRTLDKLVVKELAARVPRLRQVAERSDPMLAIYPGCARLRPLPPTRLAPDGSLGR